jgi:hypothetical protein
MELSIFLAKVIGLYALILGMTMLRKPDLKKLVMDLSKDEGIRFIASIFTLILGILMVVSHNIWEGSAYVILITIFSWMVFLKGVMLIWISNKGYQKLIEKFSSPGIMTAGAVVNLIVGIYLTYIGFF